MDGPTGNGAIDDGAVRGRREPGTARAARRSDEPLIGVPHTGDLVGPSEVAIGQFAVARMAPWEFERFISAVRNGDAADAAALAPAEQRGRRMGDGVRGGGGAQAGPTN
jgi:hypothetical protein